MELYSVLYYTLSKRCSPERLVVLCTLLSVLYIKTSLYCPISSVVNVLAGKPAALTKLAAFAKGIHA